MAILRTSVGTLLLLFASVLACSDSPSAPIPPGSTEVDLDALFAPPTTSEIYAVVADWQSRDVSAQGYREEYTAQVMLAQQTPAILRVVSHTVGGVRHYGAIVVPDDAAPRSLAVS